MIILNNEVVLNLLKYAIRDRLEDLRENQAFYLPLEKDSLLIRRTDNERYELSLIRNNVTLLPDETFSDLDLLAEAVIYRANSFHPERTSNKQYIIKRIIDTSESSDVDEITSCIGDEIIYIKDRDRILEHGMTFKIEDYLVGRIINKTETGLTIAFQDDSSIFYPFNNGSSSLTYNKLFHNQSNPTEFCSQRALENITDMQYNNIKSDQKEIN